MKHLLLIGTLFSTTAFAASLRTNIDQQFLNAPVTRNYIKNSGAEKNDAGVTDASNIHSRTTSAPLEGDGSHLIDATASGQLVVFQADDFQDGLMGQNCEAKFDYSGDASLYKAYVRLAGVKVSLDTALVNASGTQSVSINFPCGNSTTDDPDLVIESTGNGAAIKVDSVYLGKATNIGSVAQPEMVLQVRRSGSDQSISTTSNVKAQLNSIILDVYNEYDPTTNYRFTAKRAGNYLVQASLDLDASVTGSHVIRIFKNGTEQIYCANVSYTESYLVNRTECIVPLAIGDYIEIFSQALSDSSYAIYNSGASQITISRLPTTSEQVFRVGAPGQGWTAYTPTITHTSGGITNQTTTGYWRCEGSTLRGFIRTTFSNASAAFDGLRYSLPSGFTIDTTAAPIDSSVGNALLLDTGNVSVPSTVSVISSTALVVGYIRTGTTLDASPVKGIAISNSLPFTFNNTDTISINYTVPVTANSPCPAAPMPLLKHAVTTSSEGVERIERVRFGGSSELSSCTSSPCTIYSQSGNWVSSITRNAVGSYTINFVSGIFSAPPSCTCLANQPGLDDAVCGGAPNNSTSTKTINTRNSTSAYRVDTTVEVICMGPR